MIRGTFDAASKPRLCSDLAWFVAVDAVRGERKGCGRENDNMVGSQRRGFYRVRSIQHGNDVWRSAGERT